MDYVLSFIDGGPKNNIIAKNNEIALLAVKNFICIEKEKLTSKLFIIRGGLAVHRIKENGKKIKIFPTE